LDYVSTLAKEGANTPLLGGPIGLMWGALISAVLIGQWSILTQTIDIPISSLGFLWIGFAIIGGLGSVMLGKRIDIKPGANSVANRVETYVWVMFSGFVVTMFIGAILNIFLQKASHDTFDFLVVTAFAGQGLAYGVIAKLTSLRWIHMASLTSFVSSALCFSMLGNVNMYLVASLAAIITVIVPSLISMKKESNNA